MTAPPPPPPRPGGYAQQGYPQPAYSGYPYPTPPTGRPGTVTAAAIVSIVLGAFGVLIFGGFGIVALVAGDDFGESIGREPGWEDFSSDDFTTVATIVGIVCLVFAVWSAITIATAALSLGRRNWARILTIATAAVWAVLSLLSLLVGNFGGVVSLAAGVAVVVLYLVGRANDWYAGR